MRRALAVLLTVGLVLSCSDGDLPSDPDLPDAAGAISDATTGDTDGDRASNPHFFWLAPMVSQPDESLFGTFEPEAAPTVRIVCFEDSAPNATCDPTVPLITFTVGSGLTVETDHYKAELDTQAASLRTSSGEDDFTTYRIEALTPPMTLFGGPFVLGFADFQLGANGKEARNLNGTGETIGLVDGRTLPVRFRLDEGALEEEIRVNTAPTDDATGEDAFCQINCSVTVIDTDQDTEASLSDEEGDELTAILIPANTVWTTQTPKDEGAVVHVIDELVDDGDGQTGEPCLPFGDFPTEACFRHELSPDNPSGDDFTQDVRFGICPEGQAVAGGAIVPSWRLLKADEVNGEVVVTRPDEVDVTDFLSCDVSTTVTLWEGPGGELAGSALQWLVAPLAASDFWGGQLRDLSDLFWGEDVEMSRLVFPASATEGTTLQMTVELVAVHPDPDQPKTNALVTFAPTAGTGTLAAGTGFTDQDADPNTVTLVTDASGQATVDWEITEGSNRLEATSPDARPAAGETDPVAFEVTGEALVTLLSPQEGELIQQNDASLQQCPLLAQQPWRGHGYQITFDWTDASGQVDAYELEAQVVGASLALVDVTLDDPPSSEFIFTSCNSIAPGGDPDAATWTVEVVSGSDVSSPVIGSFGWTDCTLVDGTSCRPETSSTRIQVETGLGNQSVTLESCGAGSAAGTPGTCVQPGAVFSTTGTTDGNGSLLFDNAPEGLADGFWRVTPEETSNVACTPETETISLAQGVTATVEIPCSLVNE